jgi:hypothetical protein
MHLYPNLILLIFLGNYGINEFLVELCGANRFTQAQLLELALRRRESTMMVIDR